MSRIIRVFPRRTKATPTDPDVRTGPPQFWDAWERADQIHISVTFPWDMRRAEWLAQQWRPLGKVRLGGPATGQRGEEFTPGMYLREGYTITSRGCPNTCWFCDVWRRDGKVRELPIRPGWKVQDDNLLACSDHHFEDVCHMLRKQPGRPEFTGGLEAARLTDFHVNMLAYVKPKQVFFGYDLADDLEPLRQAGRRMQEAGFSAASHSLRAYVLCGFPGDTQEAADRRMRDALDAGFYPCAMLYRNRKGERAPGWSRFQKWWARPAIIAARTG